MEIADKVSVKSSARMSASASRTQLLSASMENLPTHMKNDEEGGFDILANVVWAEVGRAIMDELGNVVFAAGKPDEFRKVSLGH